MKGVLVTNYPQQVTPKLLGPFNMRIFVPGRRYSRDELISVPGNFSADIYMALGQDDLDPVRSTVIKFNVNSLQRDASSKNLRVRAGRILVTGGIRFLGRDAFYSRFSVVNPLIQLNDSFFIPGQRPIWDELILFLMKQAVKKNKKKFWTVFAASQFDISKVDFLV